MVIVAVNADKALRASQEDESPSAPLSDRMEMIDALYMVDFVTSFIESTADELIRCLRPDVYAKGPGGRRGFCLSARALRQWVPASCFSTIDSELGSAPHCSLA